MNKQIMTVNRSALALALLLAVPSVYAGGTLKMGNTKWVSVGAGLRTSFESVEDASNSGTDRSNDFDLDSIRLYVNGQIHKNIKFEFNTRTEGGNGAGSHRVDVLDGIAKFEFDAINFWVGRFLAPSDRSNMSGPYYLGDWYYPFVAVGTAGNVSANGASGRDDGAAVWGMAMNDQLKWKFGAFEGIDDGSTNSSGVAGANPDDNLMWAGSVRYNFWDTEPGYYNASTYFGAKNILSVGLGFAMQDEAFSTTADYTEWHIDGLLEMPAGGGTLTLEGAWYDYDRDNVGGLEGDAYFALAAFQTGPWKPRIRFQSYDPDAAGAGDVDRVDVGLDYIIDGHNARITVNYTDNFSNLSTNEKDAFTIGVQLQI